MLHEDLLERSISDVEPPSGSGGSVAFGVLTVPPWRGRAVTVCILRGMAEPQPRSPERSYHLQGWVSAEAGLVAEMIAERLTERTGRPHRPIDGLRWLLARGTVKSFAEGKRPSV